jgi:transposase-like protein
MESKKKSKPDNSLKFDTNHSISEGLDINDQKKLIESETLLNSFFNSPGAMRGVVEVEDNDIRHISDNFISANFFGRTQESMVSMLASQMGVDQDFIDIWIKHYEESRHTKQPINFEYEHKSDNQNLSFSATVNYLGESIRGFSRYTYVVYDITELKQAQKDLKKSRDELEKRVELRTAELAQSNKQLKQLIVELEDASAKVRTLTGMLPICSYCKKIRDDQGYWNQIEAYIRDHSDMKFSHSICQKCAEKHYPDLDIYDE